MCQWHIRSEIIRNWQVFVVVVIAVVIACYFYVVRLVANNTRLRMVLSIWYKSSILRIMGIWRKKRERKFHIFRIYINYCWFFSISLMQPHLHMTALYNTHSVYIMGRIMFNTPIDIPSMSLWPETTTKNNRETKSKNRLQYIFLTRSKRLSIGITRSMTTAVLYMSEEYQRNDSITCESVISFVRIIRTAYTFD